ncbi:MAG TPA: efflux RND transporter periplasmic adaptor subunit, partial [Verrucomicrobiae bacterium]|nr:efflux RND transporter periplasmic adaptor subunit [Verrucomicrobiae bacterium]
GRIAALPFKAGDRVSAGAVVAELSNPELAAAVDEARAAVGVARAARERVYAGVRQEEVNIAAREMDKANADLTLAKQQFARTSDLASHGHAPLQDLDNARANVATAAANLRVTQSRYAEAQRGPTAEDRALADASLAAAQASLVVLERRFDKLQLKSPVEGVVEVVVAEPGEATVPGRTVLTIADTGEPWFDFNIREDELRGLGMGTPLVLIEGVGGKQVSAKISEVRRLGDFATWRAARAVGDHDLNTFSVRADPVEPVAGLEPGVTVWIAGR